MFKRLSVILLFTGIAMTMLLSIKPAEKVVVVEEVKEYEVVFPVISEYDELMRAVEDESGVDWRLLSAIAYTESRFRGDLTSERGAVGIMQVMPSIGRHFGIADEELAEPHNNIRAAAQLLCDIESAIKLPAGIPAHDHLGILLACYNGGMGHVSDARRLARSCGEDMNSWSIVSHYLRLKSDPEYYEREVVKYGKFSSGRSTTAYVREVLKRYDHYCRMTDKAAAKQARQAAK